MNRTTSALGFFLSQQLNFPFKLHLLFGFCLLIGTAVHAQISFEQIPAPPPAPQVRGEFLDYSETHIVQGDVNGDGVLDLVVSGATPVVRVDIYKGDGEGGFLRDLDNTFQSQFSNAHALLDVDSDGDLDLIVPNTSGTLIYANDGEGNFTEGVFEALPGIKSEGIAVADFNDDGVEDIFMTGVNVENERVKYILYGNGAGIFTVQSDTVITPVYGTVASADLNGDESIDLILSGFDDDDRSTKIYFNDGLGNFTLDTETELPQLDVADIAIGDVNGDGSLDFALSGRLDYDNNTFTELFLNNGNGQFAVEPNDLINLRSGMITFGLANDDPFLDLIISGIPSQTVLYFNDGTGTFTADNENSFQPIHSGDHMFIDSDSDGDMDLLTSGITSGDNTQYYINEGDGQYNRAIDTPFRGFDFSALDVGDLNGDGLPDVIISGNTDGSPIKNTLSYLNTGSCQLQELEIETFEDVRLGAVKFADVDGDSDLDVFIAGISESDRVAVLYLNNGQGFFTPSPQSFLPMAEGDVEFADLTGNGALDLIISGGNDIFNQGLTALYFNDGSGNFTVVEESPFIGLGIAEIEIADMDNDGDQDVFFAGNSDGNGKIARLYFNDGLGNFSFGTLPFAGSGNGVRHAAVLLEDLDGNGWKDVLMTGDLQTNECVARLYFQDAEGNYTLAESTGLLGVERGSLAAADADADGDLDVLLTGEYDNYFEAANLYENDGTGHFSLVENLPFRGAMESAVAFTDMDGDGLPDIIITGRSEELPSGRLFRNTTPIPPCSSPPADLEASLTGPTTLTFEWAPVSASIACRAFALLPNQNSITIGTVQGDEPSALSVTHPSISSELEFQWRVQCACSTNPLVATPLSPWTTFGDTGGLPDVGFLDVETGADESMQIVMFPNPANDHFQLAINQTDISEITVTDLNGRKLKSWVQPLPHYDISDLETGIYIVTLFSPNQRVSQLLMKK